MMKQARPYIIGLALSIALMSAPVVKAADNGPICNDANLINGNHYASVYCSLRVAYGNTLDDELVDMVANQFGMDSDVIKEILAGTICKTMKEDPKKLSVNETVKNVCLPSGKSTEETLGSWNVFTDIRNAYEKERVIRQSQNSLTFKFKASEQYWDGKIGPGPDAPFDLLVDLNLIDITLFGSGAKWWSDPYKFPTEEDEEKGGQSSDLDPALPEESTLPKTPGLPGSPDKGAETDDVESVSSPPECVPPGSPDASGSPLCGNSSVDILLGEACDDGNFTSGDGCNQFCQKEQTGAAQQCIDPEAVTFKKPGETPAPSPNPCPPGTVPKKPDTKPKPKSKEQIIQQSPEYPGPFLGGTMKQFPESKRPPCGPGDSTVEITVAGKKEIAKDSNGNAICVPAPLCKSFDDTRDFLFGEGWEKDEAKAEIATAIEALFCVNILKENRPQSSYSKNEGCVDCHIIAMVDSIYKALEKNVTPLENTMTAFGISSKFGPKFSFNLLVAIKAKTKYQVLYTASTAIQKADENAETIEKNNTPPPVSTSGSNEAPLASVQRSVNQAAITQAGILEEIKGFRRAGEAISDQEVGGRVNALILQLRDSFASIQSRYEAMIGTIKLDEIPQCKL